MSTRRKQRGGRDIAISNPFTPVDTDRNITEALRNNLREALKQRLQRMKESYVVIRDDLRGIVKDTKDGLAACNPDKGMEVTISSKEHLQRIAMHIEAFSAQYGQNSQVDRLVNLFAGYCKKREMNPQEALYTDPSLVKAGIDSCSLYITEAAQAVYDRKGENVVHNSQFDEEVINELKQKYPPPGYPMGMNNFFVCLDQFFKDKQVTQQGGTRRKNRRLK